MGGEGLGKAKERAQQEEKIISWALSLASGSRQSHPVESFFSLVNGDNFSSSLKKQVTKCFGSVSVYMEREKARKCSRCLDG